ncbi:MAG: tripartite tricarboxylate transporter substrate binding protein [Alphaproteobacteria bacterium]|nr:tripartite tricarboxylate transporter substrate binding protein [Alphaproteobacteria bacterium]
MTRGIVRAAGLAVLALVLAIGHGAGAAAQAWPSKPIRFVIPFAPGGATDVVGRLVGDKLASLLGQPVVIENRPGGGGNLAANFVAKAPADGYTLMVGNHPGYTVGPALSKDAGFDPVRDFTAISMLAGQTLLLNVHVSFPAATLAEFVAHVKANPGKFDYATPGNGTPHHLAMELLKLTAGLDIVHVAYRGGGPMTQDVVAGRVPMMFGSYVIAGPHLEAGKLRALGATGRARVPQWNKVPTFAEQGYPDFEVTTFFPLVGPAGLPAAVVERLAKEVQVVLAMDDVRQRLTTTGFELSPPVTPAAFAAVIEREVAKWAKVIKDADIKPE